MRILFVSANPDWTPRLDIEDEIRQLKQGLKGKQFDLKMLPAAQPEDLRDFVDSDDVAIDIVHFSGHATRRDGLLFRQENGRKKAISATDLNDIFKDKPIKLAVLNACHTETTATGIYVQKTAKGTTGFANTVIATEKKLDEKAAKKMTKVLYASLGNGKTIDEAFEDATRTIKESGLEDVYKKVRLDANKPAEIKFEAGDADVDPEHEESWDRYFFESYLNQQIESLESTIVRNRQWAWGLFGAGVLITTLLGVRYSLDLNSVFSFLPDLSPETDAARKTAYQDWVSFSGEHMLESMTKFGNALPALFAALKGRSVSQGKTELRSLTKLLEVVKSSAEMAPDLRDKLFSILEQNMLGAATMTNSQLAKEEGTE